MTGWIEAGFWGLVAGSALLLGAALGYALELSQRLVAGVMAIGTGVLISALSFDLMDEALAAGGMFATALGFVAGAALYSVAGYALAQRGAKHRKRSGNQQSCEADSEGSGLAIAPVVGRWNEARRALQALRLRRLAEHRDRVGDRGGDRPLELRRRVAGVDRGDHRGGRGRHPRDVGRHDDAGGVRGLARVHGGTHRARLLGRLVFRHLEH